MTRRRDPKVRRWIAERDGVALVLGGAAVAQLACLPVVRADSDAGAAAILVGMLPWFVLCIYCKTFAPWLTPEERVAQLEREADEALAREIAALVQPRGLRVAEQAAKQNALAVHERRGYGPKPG